MVNLGYVGLCLGYFGLIWVMLGFINDRKHRSTSLNSCFLSAQMTFHDANAIGSMFSGSISILHLMIRLRLMIFFFITSSSLGFSLLLYHIFLISSSLLGFCIFIGYSLWKKKKPPCFTNHIFDYLIFPSHRSLTFYFYPLPLSVKGHLYDTICQKKETHLRGSPFAVYLGSPGRQGSA